MWFIDVEVEQETSVPPPKKNPGSAPVGVREEEKKGGFPFPHFCTFLTPSPLFASATQAS